MKATLMLMACFVVFVCSLLLTGCQAVKSDGPAKECTRKTTY